MHRIEEKDREKVYEVLKEVYSSDNREMDCFEVSYIKDEIEYYVYRMVTKYANGIGIVDYVYDENYEGEDTRSRPVIMKFTLDIPNEIMDKAIEAYGGEVLYNFAIVTLLKSGETEIEDTDKLTKWFIRHLEIDDLLDKYEEINGTGKPKRHKEVEVVDEEDTECHGGTYDV